MTKYEMMKEFESKLDLNQRIILRTIRACSDDILKKLTEIEKKCDIIITRTELPAESAKVTSSLQLELEAFKELNKVKAELEALRSASGSESESYNVADFNGSI